MNDHPSVAELLGALTNRLHHFFYCLDERHYDELIAVFAADGVWYRQGERLQGHAAIGRALYARSTTQRIRHVVTNAFVADSDGDKATVKAYMTAYRHDDGKPSDGVPRIPGPFRLNLVSTVFRRVDGGWLIEEQRLTPEFEFAGR